MNNKEKIQSMNTEELAYWIYDLLPQDAEMCDVCPACESCTYEGDPSYLIVRPLCIRRIKKWLESEED